MKRQFILLSLIASFFCSFAQKDDNQLERAQQLGTVAGEALIAKNYSVINRILNEKLREKLDQEKIEKVLISLEGSYGRIDSLIDFSVKTIAEGTYYHQGLQFDKGKFDLVFSLDDNELMKSFILKPYTNKTPWKAPEYVDLSKFSTEPIQIGNELPLLGEYTVPNTMDELAIVVMVHGSGPNTMNERLGPNEIFKDLAYGLASKGIASIRYNKRSYDYPSAMQKEANSLTIDKIVVDDAVMAIQKAKLMGAKKVILIGHSLGGHMAPRIAEREAVDGVISLAGNSSALQDLLVPQFEHLKENDSTSGINDFQINAIKYQIKNLNDGNYDSTTVGQLLPLGLPGSFWLSLKDYQPAKVAKKQEIPYLILNGERDYQVTVTEAKKWKNGSKHPLSKTIIYPKLNHMFFGGEGICIPSEYEKIDHLNSVVLNDMIDWILEL